MHKYIVPTSFSLLYRPRQIITPPSFARSITVTTQMARTSMMKAAAANKGEQFNTKPEPAKPDTVWITEDKLAELYPSVTDDGRISLPGFGPPVNYMIERDSWNASTQTVLNRLPNALQEWAPEPITVRERNMMQMINAITDKPDWRTKVHDGTILAKWQAEAVTEEGQGFTEKMFHYVSLFFVILDTTQFADTDSASQNSKIRLVSTKRTT